MTYINTWCALSSGLQFANTSGGCRCIDSIVIDENYSDSLNPYILPLLLCGCDGKTYRDPYIAFKKYGVTKFTLEGGCKCMDSSYIDEEKYIKMVSIEREINTGCRYDSAKVVCGCDSVTYASEIEAIYKYGITKFRKGKCKCIDSTIINLSIECDSSYMPVCGCNNVTYRNACIATNHYGIKDYKPGVCPCYDSNIYTPNSDCSNDVVKPKYICGCDSITYLNICQATCQFGVLNILHMGVCRCPDYKIYIPNVVCQNIYSPVCGCDGKTYKNICEAELKNGIWAIDRGNPCRCVDSNLLNKNVNCFPKLLYDPVCGCDSITYPNECTALNTYGVTSWKKGPCSYYCKDISIIDTSWHCSDQYKPVCGCDNKTYNNECQAYYKFGISNWQEGHCDSITSNSQYFINAINFYPNPTEDYLFIDSKDNKVELIIIKNIQGLSLLKFIPNSKIIDLNLTNLSTGLYFITVVLNSNKSIQKILYKN